MAWIYDTYQMMHPGENNLPVVTGKPVDMGGSLGRREATAQRLPVRHLAGPGARRGAGARRGCDGAARRRSRASATPARSPAELFAEAGARVIAVSDSTRRRPTARRGSTRRRSIAHKARTGSVAGARRHRAGHATTSCWPSPATS